MRRMRFTCAQSAHVSPPHAGERARIFYLPRLAPDQQRVPVFCSAHASFLCVRRHNIMLHNYSKVRTVYAGLILTISRHATQIKCIRVGRSAVVHRDRRHWRRRRGVSACLNAAKGVERVGNLYKQTACTFGGIPRRALRPNDASTGTRRAPRQAS